MGQPTLVPYLTVNDARAALVINVDDADAVFGKAIAAGATEQRPVENAHGGRSGWLIDPWGHRWSPFGPEKP